MSKVLRLTISIGLLTLLLILSGVAYAQSPASTGVWSPTGNMHSPRAEQTATRLQDGRVLVAGGTDKNNNLVATAELYDPTTGTWSLTGSMHHARFGHTATLLSNGKVLVAGGVGATAATAELYDPTTGTWSLTGSMHSSREGPTATPVKGMVLVAGGFNNNAKPL